MAALLKYNIIVIGSANAGKTTLAHRFTTGSFCEHVKATIGLGVSSKFIRLNDGAEVQMLIWDTAGMEANQSMTKSYYRKADAAIFVYDVSCKKSFGDIPMWFQDCVENAPENIVKVLLGNKNDMGSLVDQETAQLFAAENDMIFFETSAKSDSKQDHINQIFKTIALRIKSRGNILGNPNICANAIGWHHGIVNNMGWHADPAIPTRQQKTNNCSCSK